MSVDSALLKGKTPEQKQAIKYFLDTGCIAALTRMKDDAYDQAVQSKLNALNLKQRALGKIGLDEDQLKAIAPVFLHGYTAEGAHVRVGADDRLRTSKYDATWLFFSDTQVYMYSYTLDMTSDAKKEKTEEYFYKDITNFSTSSETTDANKISGCQGDKVTKTQREYSRFSLVVPGDKFTCSTSGVPDADRSVSAMKQKLREKKQ
ncbi:MAG: hypothetical protein WCO51_07590 [bacterium]